MNEPGMMLPEAGTLPSTLEPNRAKANSLFDSMEDDAPAQAPVLDPIDRVPGFDKEKKNQFLNSLEDEVSPLELAYRASLEANPDKAAKILDLSKRTAEPAAFIEKNLDKVEQLANAPDSSAWKQFEKQFPDSAEFSKKYMAAVKDDYQNLGAFEGFAKSIGGGLKKGNLESRVGELSALQMREVMDTGAMSGRHEAELRALEKELEPLRQLDSEFKDGALSFVYGTAVQVPNMVRAFVRVGTGESKTTANQVSPEDNLMAGDVRGGAISAAGRAKNALTPGDDIIGPAAAGAAVGSLAGPVGTRAGAVAGLAVHAYQVEAGHAFREYIGFKDQNGQALNPKVAAEAANSVGLVNAALETASDVLMLKGATVIGKAAGGITVDAATKLLTKVKIPGAERLLGIMGANPKVFEGMTISRAIREAGKMMAAQMGTELATEFAQEVSTGLGGEIAKDMSGQTFTDRKAFSTILEDSTQVLDPTFRGVLLFSALGGGASIYNSTRQIRQAEKTRDALIELSKSAAQIKLRERSPEAAGEFVGEVAKSSGLKEILLDAAGAETYFQSKNIDPETAMAELGVAEEYRIAKETGGDVAIPLTAWTQKVVGSEHLNGLLDDAKFNPEDLTPRQAKERQDAVTDEFQTALESSAGDRLRTEEIQAFRDMIREEMRAKLTRAKPKAQLTDKEEKARQKQVDRVADIVAQKNVIAAITQGKAFEEYWQTSPDRTADIRTEARPYLESVVNRILGEVSTGELIQGGIMKDGLDPYANVSGRFGRHSTYPEYFKNKGITKADATIALTKYLEGKELTDNQTKLLDDIYRESQYDSAIAVAEADAPFLQAGRGKPFILPEIGDPKSVRVVFVDSNSIGFEVPAEGAPKEERDKFREAIRESLLKSERGKKIWNESLKWEIDISADGLKHATHAARNPLNFVAMLQVPALLENAAYHSTETYFDKNGNTDRNIPFVHTLYAPIRIDGVAFNARIKIRETRDKKKFYEQVLVIPAVEVSGNKEGPDAITGRAAPEGGGVPDIGSPEMNIDEFREQIKEPRVTDSDTLNQGENDPRGMTQFAKKSTVITLFENADASTFLHESAHVWLKEMFDFARANEASMTPEFAERWLNVSKWLNIQADQTKLTVEQQEKFATHFEAYLREGKAPTEGLRKAFRSFRLWLTKLYRDLRGLNVEMSDEVRGIMDRMLATEEEIAIASREIGTDSVAVNLEGVPEEVKTKIASLQEQAREEAEGILLRKQMDELKTENREFLAAQRARIEREVRAEVEAMPIYQVMGEVRAKVNPKRTAEYLAKKFLDGKLEEEQAGVLQGIAELGGFTDAENLAKSITAVMPLEQRIGETVRIRMDEFVDLKDSSRIKEEAMKAVHNDRQLELMALEREILDSLVKGAVDNEALKKRKAEQAKVDGAAAKAQAKKIIGALNIRAATAFQPFFTQERNWATKAAKAIARKDFDAAAIAKRQQLVNHALALESLRVKKQVDKWVKYLEETQRKKRDLFKIDDHFNQAAEILGRIGFERRDYDSKYRKESLSEWAQRMDGVTNTVNVAPWILEENQFKDYQELSIDQLSDVVDALKNIQSVANFEKRAVVIMNGADIDEIVRDLIFQSKLNVREDKRQKFTMEPGRFDEAKSLGAKYLLSITRIQNLLKGPDGHQDFGKWFKVFWESVYNAANKETALLETYQKGLEKAWAPYSEKERRALMDAVYRPEIGTKASKMRLIMMALNLGNDGNRARLFETPPVGVDSATRWDGQVVMQMLQKNLDERDWQFVQSIWDHINSYWPQLEEMHKGLTGFAPKKVPAQPFNVALPDGRVILLAGGYFPLKEDPRSSHRADIREQLDAPLYTESNPAWKAATRTGHTKERAEGAQYAVSLDPSIIFRHGRDMIHDLAFRPTVIDLRRVVDHEEFQKEARSVLGREGYTLLREWVSSVAAGQVNENAGSVFYERAVAWLRRQTVTSVLMLKTSVIAQNLANPFLYAGAVEGFGHKEAFNAFFVRGVLNFLPKAMFDRKGYREMRDFVHSRSAFMRDKSNNPDFALTEMHNKLFGRDSKLQEFATGLMAGSDELSSIPMWVEAYNLALDKNMEDSEAVLYADTLIDRVLGSGRKYDTAAIQRGGELARMVSMFYSFLNVEYNRWASEAGAARLDPKKTMRFLGFMGSRLLFFVPASALLSGKGPGDDEDKVAWWLKEVLGYPMSFFPGFRDIGTVALDNALGLRSFGYRPTPAVSGIETVLRGIGKAASSESDLAQRIEGLSKTASVMMPYPDQINSWFWNGYDIFINDMDPELSDLYRRRPIRER